jgi:hypothetical protein
MISAVPLLQEVQMLARQLVLSRSEAWLGLRSTAVRLSHHTTAAAAAAAVVISVAVPPMVGGSWGAEVWWSFIVHTWDGYVNQ